MVDRVQIGGLGVAASLHRFVDRGGAARARGSIRRRSGRALDAIVHDLAPRNRELLARRDELQARIDDWHREHPGAPDAEAYTAFLTRDRLPARRARRRRRSPPTTSTTRSPASPARSWSCRC